jgi:crotonobetainyl-CoA:carnitine CoA-transferase CaiB-like acyl-CoA transferase
MKSESGMGGALEGLRVLDLSRVLAGPWSSQLLGDLGADVVKVERPNSGDDTRAWGPPWLQGDDGQVTAESAYYLCANRNKRSLTVDISKPDGQRLIQQLALKADILIENFKVGGLQVYGLDYPSLKALNPRLIYCSITGFGQTGPYANRPGYDFLVQGMGGLMSLTGRPDGTPGGGPLKVGVALTDILTGLYATVGILAAVAFRERTGVGQHLDLALLDVQVAALANQASNYLIGGCPPGRLGNAHPNIVPYQDFKTSDGFMIIAVGNDTQFDKLCKALGHADWALDERFRTNPRRVEHRDMLIGLIQGVTVSRTTDEWMEVMEAVGVPCGPINSIDKVFANPQVQAREMQIELEHRTAGRVPLVANPIRMSESPVEYRLPPPALGDDSSEVLRTWLGLTESEIRRIRGQKANDVC